METPPIGHLVSLNSGRPRRVRGHDRTVTTAIWKQPVDGRVRAADVNLDGDDQADRRVHGGPTKAVYAYALGDYRWWASELGAPLAPTTFGENRPVAGVDLTAAIIRATWRIGTTTLRVTEPRIPCSKLGIRMGEEAFVDRFANAGRPGTHCAIEQPGEVGAADTITLLHRPRHGVTVGAVERAYHGQAELLPLLADLEDLSEAWRDWARAAASPGTDDITSPREMNRRRGPGVARQATHTPPRRRCVAVW